MDVPETDDMVREAVCELANQVIGNAVATLNDQGFHFRVHPPVLHTSEHGSKSTEDTEALVLCFDTASGNVTDASMAQSIGNPILDNATVSTFRRWRFQPGKCAPKVKVPITYPMTGASY